LIILGCYHEGVEEEHLLAESALQALLDFSKLDQIKACVIDSVAALCAETELFNPNGKERDLFDSQPMAGMAKVFNKFTKDFHNKTKVAPLLMINHYREAINIGPSFVPPSQLRLKTPGGRTKEFLSDIRILATSNPLWANKGAKHSSTGSRVQEGMEVNYKIFKNKYANPDSNRLAKVHFNFADATFTNAESLLNFALFFTFRGEDGKLKSRLEPSVIQTGAWIMIGDDKFQGTEKAVQFLKERREIYRKLEIQLVPMADQFYGDKKEFSAKVQLDD
jgi:RecA/RadA recombinase